MNNFEEGLRRYLTQEQIALIQKKKIGIGGAGGLGSNLAMILVRSGFSSFEIIDQDVIDSSNLNRQQYFIDEIGKNKVDCLKARLLAINPDIDITIHKQQWNEETAETFFQDSAFIVEAFDQADWKHRFVQYYQPRGIPLISGNGMAGLLNKKPMTIKKLGNIYFVGDLSTDTACGHPPMAPRVTACAAKMAEIILDLTLGIEL